MYYENLLTSVKGTDKETIKKVILKLDTEQFERIRELEKSGEFSQEVLNEWRLMVKDRSFFEMLLVNALKD